MTAPETSKQPDSTGAGRHNDTAVPPMLRKVRELLPAFLLTTLVGALLTFGSQYVNQRYQQRAARTAADRASATSVYEEASRELGRRIFHLQRRMTTLHLDSAPMITPASIYPTDSAGYENHNRLRAQLCRYFGVQNTLDFDGLNESLDVLGIEWTAYEQWSGADSARREVREVWEEARRALKVQTPKQLRDRTESRLDTLSSDVYRYNLRLIDAVRAEDFPVLSDLSCVRMHSQQIESKRLAVSRLEALLEAVSEAHAARRASKPKKR